MKMVLAMEGMITKKGGPSGPPFFVVRPAPGGCPITGIVARGVEDGPKYSRI